MNTHTLNPSKKTKNAEAFARFQVRHNQTCMIDRYATAPLKWSKSFPDGENGAIYLYLQDVSPGMLDGDQYRVQIELDPGSDVSLRTTTYGKLHPSPQHGIELNQHIRVNSARFSYCPEPIIPYINSNLRSRTTIELDSSAQLFWSESWAPGRVHKGEQFGYTKIQSELEILQNGNYIAWDPFSFQPSAYRPDQKGAWESFSHCGSIWIVDSQASNGFWQELITNVRNWGGTLDGEWPDEKMEHARTFQNQTSPFHTSTLRMAISQLDGPGVSIRILSNQAERIQQAIHHIWHFTRQHAWNQYNTPWQPPGENQISTFK